VDGLRREGTPPVLVDAGNFFDTENRLNRLVSVVAWKEMERLGYDAVALGARELASWRLVELLLAEDSLRVVTTNLEHRVASGWEPVGVRSRVVVRDGVRVGILGITMDSEMAEWIHRAYGDSLRVQPAVPAAQAAIQGLAGATDIILALLAGTNDDLVSFAAAVPEVDVIVGGGCAGSSCRPRTRDPERIGHAVVNTAASGGSSVAVTELLVAPHRGIIEYAGAEIILRRGMPEDTLIAHDAARVMGIVREMHEERRTRGK
jgi:2',3'-cyclic-nucleotide 2'-phosphodiesterase (5'-nucleotidase family)